MLVMGNRGLGRFTGALVGSVTQHCIQHADCPVLVIGLDKRRSDWRDRVRPPPITGAADQGDCPEPGRFRLLARLRPDRFGADQSSR